MGLIIWETYSFERQKVYLFISFVIIAVIEWALTRRKELFNILSRYWKLGLLLTIVPIVAMLFSWQSWGYFLWGSTEKHHGYIFFTAVLIFIGLMMTSSKIDLKKYLAMSLASAVFVAIVAIGEVVGGSLDIFHHQNPLSPYVGRAISTLGNPNYVAGYLLPFVPILITKLRKPILGAKNIVIAIFLSLLTLAIITTKSLIGISLLVIIILWYIVQYFIIRKKTQIIVFSILLVWLLVAGFTLIGGDKWLSLESRFVLQFEGLKLLFQYPLSFLVGFGPDSLGYLFFTHRTPLLDSYFPPAFLIDSTHNVWLDILMQYWLVVLWALIYIFMSVKKKQSPYILPLVTIAIFFSLNVAVIVHVMIFILFFALYARDTQG